MSGHDASRPDEAGWDRGFDAHADAQRRRIASLPLWVRIEWLEETQRLLAGLRRVDRAGDPDESSS